MYESDSNKNAEIDPASPSLSVDDGLGIGNTQIPNAPTKPSPMELTGEIGHTIPIKPDNASQVKQLFRVGDGIYTSIARSPDGSYISIGSAIGIYTYDSKSLMLLNTIETSSYVTTITYSPDSNIINEGAFLRSLLRNCFAKSVPKGEIP